MRFTIPDAELHFRASRGGGPGGQHVNKVSTRVEVRWNVFESPSVTDSERRRLRSGLAHRLDGRGWVRVSSSARRSQLQNRETAVARLHEIVNDALRPVTPRKKSKPSRAAREARLAEKKRRARKKIDRKPVQPDD